MPALFSLLLCANVIAQPMPLTRGPDPAARIVVIAEQPDAPLTRLASGCIAATVQRWSGVDLPVIRATPSAAAAELNKPAIVLTTLDALQRVDTDLVGREPLFGRLGFFDGQGFVVVPTRRNENSLLLVVGRTPRGMCNGAQYLADFRIDGLRNALTLDTSPVARSPHFRKHPVYLLTIWGEEDEYALDDWRTVFKTFARDGVTDVYFWLSGHFPSKKYPQTVKLNDNNWDSTIDSRLTSLDDQRQLIRAAHDLGMRFYLGGALGAWCGSYMLTNREPGTMRIGSKDEQGNDSAAWSLCPASEKSRAALIDYYVEMYDALPDADGLYMESGDEYGECRCERCSKTIDADGCRMFGQYQLTLMQEMMRRIWEKHPRARLCYTIGYSPHVNNPAYYEVVRQMSADPRIEWMEARNSWTFPGPGSKPLPNVYFSPQVMRWQYYDCRPLELLVNESWRAATSGHMGFIVTFSPGFHSGSFYHEVPLRTDRLPYVLTHFVSREAHFEPVETVAETKQRCAQRFFGAGASADLMDRLWELRDLLDETANKKLTRAQAKVLEKIEAAIADAKAETRPRARETLEQMQQAVADIRRICKPVASRPAKQGS